MPTWQPGDPVFARFLDPATGLYCVKGWGRVLRVEGTTLVVRTRSGEEQAHVDTIGFYRSREEGEAALKLDPSPVKSTEPMAHHTAPVKR